MSAQTGYVCGHVMEGKPALRILHYPPMADDDTGIVLMCGASGHTDGDCKIVAVERFLQAQEITELAAELPVSARAMRASVGQPWVIEAIPAEEAA